MNNYDFNYNLKNTIGQFPYQINGYKVLNKNPRYLKCRVNIYIKMLNRQYSLNKYFQIFIYIKKFQPFLKK